MPGHRHVGGALAELRAVAANGLELELRTARSLGCSQPLATVTVGPPLPADQTEALRFNPWTTGPGIHPSGWLNLLRDAAYQASQRGAHAAAGRPEPPRPGLGLEAPSGGGGALASMRASSMWLVVWGGADREGKQLF